MRRPRSALLVTGVGAVGLFVATAALAPVFAPYDPRAFSGAPFEPPSSDHLLGTDGMGRDMLSQLMWGARASLVVAVGAATLTTTVAAVVGSGAALVGGLADRAVVRVVDMYLAVPVLPLLLLVAAASRPGLATTIVVIGVVLWPFQARVLRAQTRTLRQRGFVAATRGLGAGPLYVLRRHILPGLGPLIVAAFVNVAQVAVLLEAGLALLGVGDPTGVSWGMILNRALQQRGLYLTDVWTWSVLPAGLAVTSAVLGLTFLGVGLEPWLNPRSRRAAA